MAKSDKKSKSLGKKAIGITIVCFILLFLFFWVTMDEEDYADSSSGGYSDTAQVDEQLEQEERGDEEQTWAVYWYLCGSDLETNYGCASGDLSEMFEVTLPENVKVVVENGGADEWQEHGIKSNELGRYVYSSEGWNKVDSQPAANMGAPDTLADFLSFCKKNYPADRTMVLFWNHGGGSVSGAAFDENYDFDSLTLNEFGEAFNKVFTANEADPPIDIIGFDTCLMATIDTASTFSGLANYLVASEELEPGNGWYYTGWLQALANDPAMGGAQLGRAICDSYMKGCKMAWTDSDITLSVTDLTKLEPLLKAYDSMGREALVIALDAPYFFTTFGREAGRSESYGGNTEEEGYTNMVDLGHLVRNSKELLPETAQAVLDGLEECVIYKVNGTYRSEATGLSCYYSYNKDVEDFKGYTEVGYSESFKYLYGYSIGGELSDAGMEYVNNLGYIEKSLPQIPTLDTVLPEEDYPVSVNDDGFAVLDIGKEAADLLTGVFMDNFRGVWGSIDGHLVYMEIIFEGDDYNTYSVPILLNGEEYNLRVVYDFNEEKFNILGARQGLDDTGMADKNLVQLKEGDEITTILYMSSIYGEDDFEAYGAETFNVTKETSFYEVWLGDGEYMEIFELVDASNNTAWSDPVYFEIEGDDIYTSVYEE